MNAALKYCRLRVDLHCLGKDLERLGGQLLERRDDPPSGALAEVFQRCAVEIHSYLNPEDMPT